MAYQDITQYNAVCFTRGRPYGIASITIHWWGDPGTHPTFEGVVDTFVTGARRTSAHYVAEAGRVACLVDPDDRAWACGDGIGCRSGGNDCSISIECNPRESDGDYGTVAELLRDLRAVYGDLTLYPHNLDLPRPARARTTWHASTVRPEGCPTPDTQSPPPGTSLPHGSPCPCTSILPYACWSAAG